MNEQVKLKIDIDNHHVDDWLIQYLGGQALLTILQISKRSRRREALKLMLESPKYQHIKDRVTFDSKGQMTVIFPSEKHKTIAMLK